MHERLHPVFPRWRAPVLVWAGQASRVRPSREKKDSQDHLFFDSNLCILSVDTYIRINVEWRYDDGAEE